MFLSSLYEINKEAELSVHVFPGVPPAPGMPCQGEDRSIYRRGARRWRKLYKVNGHIFQAKRFNRKAFCAYCHDRIWGLGRQGFKCTQCKLMIHKKCHKLLRVVCDASQVIKSFSFTEKQVTRSIKHHNFFLHNICQSEFVGKQNNTRKKEKKTYRYMNTTLTRLKIRQVANLPQGHLHGYPDSGNGTPEDSGVFGGGTGPGGPGHVGDENMAPMEEVAATANNNAEQRDNSAMVSLEDFELMRVIGRGSYAKVLMVELKRTRRIYAMKVIKKELVTDDEDIDWVQTEKHVFETASNHPFLVGLHSCFQVN